MTNDLPLTAYAEQLSGRPGETLEFKVSSRSHKPFTARLVRSISADPNPDGPGMIEEDASAFFAPQEFASVHRPFFPGSYGIATHDVSADKGAPLVFSATVFPTQCCEPTW